MIKKLSLIYRVSFPEKDYIDDKIMCISGPIFKKFLHALAYVMNDKG
jgi:hypothetical protein